MEVVGLTSPEHVELLRGTGLYDEVLGYDDIAKLNIASPAAYVDFAGRADVTRAVHERLGEVLKRSVIVGLTHWEATRVGAATPPPGPAPAVFFAPDQIQKRMNEWGPAVFQERFVAGLRAFVTDNAWLKLRHHTGPDALAKVYADVLEGRVRPDEGHIVRVR